MIGRKTDGQLREIKRLRREREQEEGRARHFTRDELLDYRDRPEDYFRDVLGVTLWSKQAEIARSLHQPPYRTLVLSSHSTGKTFCAAALVNYWYDTHDPGAVVTTAPTARDVRDLLWKEVRIQRKHFRDFPGHAMPILQSSDDHYAKGFTAKKGESFQGRHDLEMLFVFDEAVGVEATFWITTKTMFKPEAGHAWLAIFNPTDTTSQAYIEEQTGRWNVIRVSALDHPNIEAELDGRKPPYPSAISLSQLEDAIKDDCQPVSGEIRATDFEWPPGSGNWLRPGPIFESRWLGRWPSQGTYGVWSDADWLMAESIILPIPLGVHPQIGCDVARYGDDWTSIHVRCGPVSLHHESANGWSTTETAGRLKQLAAQYAVWWNTEVRESSAEKLKPQQVLVKIDDDGVGGGVVDQRGDYSFVPVSAAASALHPEDYPNRRSELWFTLRKRASEGRTSFARLPKDVRQRLRQQFMAPKWKLDSEGRRVVEPKEKTKETLKRSPDDADAANLAYYEHPSFVAPRGKVEQVSHAVPTPQTRKQSNQKRRGMFGQ